MEIGEITSTSLFEILKKEDTLLIDVREVSEFSAGYIDSAINVPLASLSDFFLSSLKNNQDFSSKIVVLQCRSGVRSKNGCITLANLGIKCAGLYNLTGGILSWHASGYPIELLPK
jgi:rhodanese-related sulfurtransferase